LCGLAEQVVTANYPARAAGVGKLMNIKDAVKACPDLVLVRGLPQLSYMRNIQ
jgi:nucleotidyltransferase/DNA polymerase involved in DNA repair